MKIKYLFLAILLLFLLPGATTSPPAKPETLQTTSDFQQFENELEILRERLHIPGLAAAIVSDQELVWTGGFGLANIDKGTPVTADTPFHLASVTKPIAATLIMQLVEQGKLDLDDPVSRYGVHFQDPDITVRHLLTHTSEGTPGTAHNYNGNRYAYLAKVISGASGKSFGQLLSEQILVPLDMDHTAPNPNWFTDGWEGYFVALGTEKIYANFPDVYGDLARPYQFDTDYNNIPGSYPLNFSPAAGLVASVNDLATFDIALDQDLLLQPETRETMFTPARANSGQSLIYGLGWYTQQFNGTRIIWHSGGWPPSVSALIMKVPDENLTFIALANNYNLTRPYPLGDGDVLFSTPALLFYKQFVFPKITGKTVPTIDWTGSEDQLVTQLSLETDPQVRQVLERELWSYRKLFASVGEFDTVDRLLAVHQQAFPASTSAYYNGTIIGVNDAVSEPIPVSLMPEDVATAAWFLLVWLVLIGLSFLSLVIDLRHEPRMAWPYQVAWAAITILFGVLGLAAYWLSDRYENRPIRQSWRRALGPALFTVTGNMTGFGLGLLLIINYFPDAPGALPAILAMLLVGWLLFRTPLSAWTTGRSYWRSLPRCLLAELGSTLVVLIGAIPTVIYLLNYLFRDIPGSPLIIAGLVLGAITGAIPAFILSLWQVRRGSHFWNPYQIDHKLPAPQRRPRLV